MDEYTQLRDNNRNFSPHVRHPEHSEGSPNLARGLLQEIPHCVRDDVRGERAVTFELSP